MLNIQRIVDDAKWCEVVRELRWPDGVRCPKCGSAEITKRGYHSQQVNRQRYECQECWRQFDDVTDTIFEGHHQPLQAWVVGLYLMGLNLSNQQIAAELELNEDEVQGMATQLREGVMAKKSQ